MSTSADLSQPAPRRGSPGKLFITLTLMLLLWVVGFLAFLVAPILVLIGAWVIGLAFIAGRGGGQSRQQTGEIPVVGGHRFGSSSAREVPR